jgi:2-polyprenyl-3-methyl-5-hydroxy-6-metoxy-1,4-benzoquinol methylase
MFCHYASNKGAKVTGIDMPLVIEIADLYKLYKGVHNIDFISKELFIEDLKTLGKFDIVFYFAMIHSLGRPLELKNLTKELLIYEGHNLEDENKTEEELKKIFNKVEYKGKTKDRGIRPIFWCWR